jgi:hypothetical protein
MWRLVGPAVALGSVGATLGDSSGRMSHVAAGGVAGVMCGLLVGASTYGRARTATRAVYLIIGCVVTWLLMALVLPGLIGGSIGLDTSAARAIGIGITICCLISFAVGLKALGRREDSNREKVRKDTGSPIPTRTRWWRGLVVAGMLAVLAFAAVWSWTTYQRLKIKLTVSRIATLGRVCASEQPVEVDAESLKKLIERLGGSDDDLADAWGNRILVIRIADESGAHYIVAAVGPGLVPGREGSSLAVLPPEAQRASFVWRDGEWLREYDPRRGGIVERK